MSRQVLHPTDLEPLHLLVQKVAGGADLLLGVLGGDEEPKPCQRLLHGGVDDRVRAHAAAKEAVGELQAT